MKGWRYFSQPIRQVVEREKMNKKNNVKNSDITIKIKNGDALVKNKRKCISIQAPKIILESDRQFRLFESMGDLSK